MSTAADLAEADRPLSGEEILLFGPVVESAVWNLAWLPLAEGVTPAKPSPSGVKLGNVFSEGGVGRAVVIRPCMSRGRRVRGMAPVYTQAMLKENATVFSGWSMYMNHLPAKVQEAVDAMAEASGLPLAERNTGGARPVQDLGGQILRSWWDPNYVAEDDAAYGYQKGAVLAEIWATPFVRNLVGENPGLLHTSIAAWPKGGKPGNVPWAPAKRGMIIEGIRAQPQGSVDFVPRGGAGGRLLPLAESADFDPDTGEHPTPGWSAQEEALVVSLAEAVYAPPMSHPVDLSKLRSRAELDAALAESHPHLVAPAAQVQVAPVAGAAATCFTKADAEAMISEALANVPTEEQITERIQEGIDAGVAEERTYSAMALAANEVVAEAALPAGWKAKITRAFQVTKDGPSSALVQLAEEEDPIAAATEAAKKLVEEADELIQESRGGAPKPRVTGQGGKNKSGNDGSQQVTHGRTGASGRTSNWRDSLAESGVVKKPDDAMSIFGGPVAGQE